MRSLEEIKAMFAEGNKDVDTIHEYNYNGIVVRISDRGFVMIKPVGSTVNLKSDTEDVEAQVRATPANGSFMGVPKSVWEGWLAEPFHW